MAVAAPKAGDIARFGELMNASHASLRDDYEIAAAVEDATRSVGFLEPTIYATSAQEGARKVYLGADLCS
ncbi:hypothetical protein [Corynebacterium appendicis]|uniref:hypothetical protein n=1 Tax=Corynebacterium appendicis TaxID=163202 RepID=UPI002357C365|nr:hypothetical protein [Corynebacterium appendicis]